MHNEGPCDELDVELDRFWNRRDELNDEEWARFYECVQRVLWTARPRQLSALPTEQVRDLISEFFALKVFESTSRNKQTVNARFLRVAYRNYLSDLLRDQRRRQSLAQSADCSQIEDGAPFPRDEVSVLSEVGLTMTAAAQSARQFLTSSEEWVRLFLGLHYCQDKESGEPLYTLARRLSVAAYQYRARQLGITRKKGEIGEYVGYENTLLGQWLGSLKVDVRPENNDLILVLFKILCHEALKVQRKGV